jgi:hypothetical protein
VRARTGEVEYHGGEDSCPQRDIVSSKLGQTSDADRDDCNAISDLHGFYVKEQNSFAAILRLLGTCGKGQRPGEVLALGMGGDLPYHAAR